mmetsp:Transcript_30295/g.35753  ORF Transcript_30295/g.35753 Transcript_30295/m.35753 type:complete len:215 (+) Transcript_30295:94-738(+)
MEPSMSTRNRHTDVKKTEFLRQICKHEQNFGKNTNTNPCPRSRPFVFRQTYALTSLHGKPSENKFHVSKVPSNVNPDPNKITTSEKVHNTNHGFSSFRFNSSLTSDIVGQHIDNDQFPKRMSLKEQKKYGGASMAGLTLKSENINNNDSLTRIANAEPKHQRLVYEAAVAFPALARDDPALHQLMESVDVLESRRNHLQDKLKMVEDKLNNWDN